jgi:hypothetical protein
MPVEDVVLGLDLARACGVVVRGMAESFAGPQPLPTMLTLSRVIYLLGGVTARPPSPPPPPPSFGPQVLIGCWPVVESPLGCCFGAKEVFWRGHANDRFGAIEDKAPSS